MRLEAAIGKTLTGLGLAAAPVPERGGTVAAGARLAGGEPARRNSAPSPTPPALGGMAGYEGLIVQKIDFPDLPSANTTACWS